MARMMPAFCPSDVPPGERLLYDALASDPACEGWIVLHSLALAQHVRQVEGEADFVVIVPGAGVLVIEVKSHLSVEVLPDGRWRLGSQPPSPRSPFRQAQDAMYSIRNYLEKRRVDVRSCAVMSAVWFTHVRARAQLSAAPEFHDWQVLDSQDLAAGAGSTILRTLASGARHLTEKIPQLNAGAVGPDAGQAAQIAKQLRPRFEVHVVAGDVRRARTSQLAEFLDEQYQALDAMADNRSVLFSGPAGSGKTMLAVEAARREAAAGRRGRLLCFNRLLAKSLAGEVADLNGLAVGTFHQELLRLTGIQPPADAGTTFWDGELADLALEVLLDGQDHDFRDFLVVDEFQDLSRRPFLELLDLMVEGGLARGRVLAFGDLTRQAIFAEPLDTDALRTAWPPVVVNRLTVNCRNMPRIGFVTNALSRLEPAYERFRRRDDGVDPVCKGYGSAADQSAMLLAAVRQLRDESFELDEIVVLSPLARASVAQSTEDPWLRQVLRPVDGDPVRPGQLRYGTIHAFKGLEAPAIVVTDLDRSVVPHFESLLYVALTRATDRLYAFFEATTLREQIGGVR